MPTPAVASPSTSPTASGPPPVHHDRARRAAAFASLHLGGVDHRTGSDELGEQQLRLGAVGTAAGSPFDELVGGNGRGELVEHLGERWRQALDGHRGGRVEAEHAGAGRQLQHGPVRR
ncbi:hypothetical protein [Pseudonocardia cypriaca]|uniref:hypothetical protein n=1 Tax=Pseudonocardia cypriaca TaxID=882449 RepID=UPI001476BF01|nr:hypothetical protein [Pseudonocardia cypriaca]